MFSSRFANVLLLPADKPKVITYSFPGAMNPPMEISYFDFGGKAEAIRLLAYHGEVRAHSRHLL